MKLFKVFNKEIHDHYIILSIFALFLFYIWFQTQFINKDSCHAIEPAITCQQIGQVTRAEIMKGVENGTYINTSLFTIHNYDEYRQLPKYGFLHAEFNKTASIGYYHRDLYNASPQVNNVFGVVAHLANQLSTDKHFHLADYVAVLIIWGAIWFGGYYGGKEIIKAIYKG